MRQWSDELQLLPPLDSEDLSCHYALDPLCQCGVPARQGVVHSELRYDYFCGNVVGEDDAWVSSYKQKCNMWFISTLITMISIESFNWQHTRRCDWETFEGHEKFLEQVWRKGDKLRKMMMYKRKQEMREKYLKVPSGWILGTIKRELNAFGGDTLEDPHDRHETDLHTGDKTVDSILLRGFGIYSIMICYSSLLRQDMSYEIGAR
jgi:hypothetical protein